MNRSTLRRLGAALVCLLGVVAAASGLAQGVEHQVRRHAAVDQAVRVRGSVNYHPCGNVVPTTITVIRAPAHGTLAVRDEIVPSTDPDLGRANKCKGYSGAGKVVYYTRTSPGTDVFEYTSSSVNGVVRFDVTVD